MVTDGTDQLVREMKTDGGGAMDIVVTENENNKK